MTPSVTRTLIAAGLLLAGAVTLSGISRTEAVPLRESLESFPVEIDGWRGYPAPDFEPEALEILGVDDYLNRVYLNRADNTAAALYIGYYQTQRAGDTIHSPLNCLPGSGWMPLSHTRITIPVQSHPPSVPGGSAPRRGIEINRYVIQKDLDRQLVLYWYQSHGRVIGSEYWGKFYLALDAMRLNRTDAALVRIVSPVRDSSVDAEHDAEKVAVSFAQSVFPRLSRYLPE